MTPAEILAIAALGLFAGVSLWLGLTDRPSTPALSAPDGAPLDGADFTRTPLMTPEQARLYLAVARHLDVRDDGHRALPQAPLDALLAPRAAGHPAREDAVREAITGLRVDIGILDAGGRLVAAAALAPPDDITCAALRRAGIPLVLLGATDPRLPGALTLSLDGTAPARQSA